MPKTVTLADSKWRMSAWVDDTGDMQVTVTYELSGDGVSQSKSKDVTPDLTAAKRKAVLDFAASVIAAAKASEGV